MRVQVLCVAFLASVASAANGQSSLAYDFTIRDSTPSRVEVSSGRTTISGTSVRMDMRQGSGFSRVGGAELGDSISIISVDTGAAQTVSLLGHKNKSYIQFQPVALLRAQNEQLSKGPGVSQLDFSGSSVNVDSLGPGEDIAGYKTIHFRLKATVRVSLPGMPMGEQTVVADYYGAPALAEFSNTGKIGYGVDAVLAYIPGVPNSLREQLTAADKRVRAALPLKSVIVQNGALFGTGVSHAEMFEVTNVQRVEAPSALFTVPADYQRVVRQRR